MAIGRQVYIMALVSCIQLMDIFFMKESLKTANFMEKVFSIGIMVNLVRRRYKIWNLAWLWYSL